MRCCAAGVDRVGWLSWENGERNGDAMPISTVPPHSAPPHRRTVGCTLLPARRGAACSPVQLAAAGGGGSRPGAGAPARAPAGVSFRKCLLRTRRCEAASSASPFPCFGAFSSRIQVFMYFFGQGSIRQCKICGVPPWRDKRVTVRVSRGSLRGRSHRQDEVLQRRGAPRDRSRCLLRLQRRLWPRVFRHF